jgi:hypothetical protein
VLVVIDLDIVPFPPKIARASEWMMRDNNDNTVPCTRMLAPRWKLPTNNFQNKTQNWQ